MFDMFARLEREEGKPPAEKQLSDNGAWRYKAVARQVTRRDCYAVLALVLAALVLALTLKLD